MVVKADGTSLVNVVGSSALVNSVDTVDVFVVLVNIGNSVDIGTGVAVVVGIENVSVVEVPVRRSDVVDAADASLIVELGASAVSVDSAPVFIV